jgi:hypothetical protein
LSRPGIFCGAGCREGQEAHAARISQVEEAIDRRDAKYGKHPVLLSSSFAAMPGNQHEGDRAELPHRRTRLLPGERKRLGIPRFHWI